MGNNPMVGATVAVAIEKANGKTPLFYEDWPKTIKGEKGDKGDTGALVKMVHQLKV